MTITKRNYLLHTALLTVLIGIVGGWAYFSINPHHYFGGYPLIPLFFFVFGVFMINMTESCRHRMPGRMLQIYLLMRVMRMLVSMIVMLVYCVAVREEARAFLLTFIANYLIYLFVSPSETEVVAQAHQFLLINAFFYIPLVLVNTVRFTIQGMGFSGFAMFVFVPASMCFNSASLLRSAKVSPGFVFPFFLCLSGFSAACFASPLAWILADAFLVPAFIHCLHKLQKAKSSQVTSLY